MLSRNWTARVEALAVDLGNDTVTTAATNGTYITRFSNKVVEARGGVSLKW